MALWYYGTTAARAGYLTDASTATPNTPNTPNTSFTSFHFFPLLSTSFHFFQLFSTSFNFFQLLSTSFNFFHFFHFFTSLLPPAQKHISRGPAWSSTKETQERFKNQRYNNDDRHNNHQNEERVFWEWSKAALQTVELYKRKFPRVFQALASQRPGEYKKFNPKDVCGSDDEFDRLCLWLQQLRTYKLPLVPSESSSMCKAACQAVQTTSEGKTLVVYIPVVHVLLLPLRMFILIQL
jgi:hypothetical protein